MLQPTTAEQRKDIYEDVQELIAPGFLSHHADVGSIRLCFRSPSPTDFFLLSNRMAADALEKDWKAWTVAQLVWMADGQIVLGDQRAERELFKTFQQMPFLALNSLFHIVVGLTQRMRDAVERIEAFCYEDLSRYMWKQIGLNLTDVSGIPNIGRLGFNSVQQIWISVNQLEDERQQQRSDWECAKLVASVHSYKSIKKMSQQERIHLDHEKQRRQEVMDRTYYKAKGYKVDEESSSSDGVVWKSKSKEQLADEYRRWVEGEMDFHDRVVEDYKNRIRSGMIAEQERIRALNEQYQREVDELQIPDTAPAIVGYTQEQMLEILAQKNDRYRGGTPVYFEDKKFTTFNRHIAPRETPSDLNFKQVFGEQSDSPSLDEQIAMREQKRGGS